FWFGRDRRADMSRSHTAKCPSEFRSPSALVKSKARYVFVDQSAAYHCRHLLDGGNALSAAAVRLSLRSGEGLEAIRDVQGNGTALAEVDHQPGDDCDLGVRVDPGLDGSRSALRLVCIRLAADEDH